MRIVNLALLAAAGVCLWVSGASAFDGERGGFVLGFGAGVGLTSFTQTIDDFDGAATSDRQNEFSLGSDFKIGGGIGDRFLLYYVNRIAWLNVDNDLYRNEMIVNGVGLLGASYYFQETAPSWYVLGLLGISTWGSLDEGDSEAGFGVGAGAGWEFTRHWSVEATINWGKPSEDWVETNAVSFLVTINGLAY